jgi:hypothetical protein
MLHRFSWIFALAALAATVMAAQERAFMTGRVIDKETKQPLPAYVMIEGGGGVSTGADGRFRLPLPSGVSGPAKITAFLIGFKKTTVEAKPGDDLTIALDLEPLSVHEVTVTADSRVSDEKNPKTVSLNRMDVYRIPGAAADPLYASHILPGVNSPPDASSLLIRGGAPEEVGYYFDGIEILHPFLSESLHESYFSIFDNQVIENFSVATSGLHPKYGNAMSGVMDISAKGRISKSEGGLGLSVLGLNSYAGIPLKNAGSLVASYDRGFSEILTRLNSRGGGREFQTEQAFGKFELEINKSNRLRFYGLYNGYRYSQKEDFQVASENSTGGLSWTLTPARNFAATWLVAFTRYNVDFEEPDSIRVDSRDDVWQSRLDFFWDLDRHFLEFGADVLSRLTETDVRREEAIYGDRLRAVRSGFYINDKFRLTDRVFANIGGRGQSLSLLDHGWSFDPRASLAFLLTRRDILRFSTGRYHQFGDYNVLENNPGLKPKSALHFALSYDRITDALELRATLYDKEYRRLFLDFGGGRASNGGTGYARGAEFFLKTKGRTFELLFVYNFLDSQRKENEAPTPAPSPYEISHSLTGIVSWKFKNGSLGLRYSTASGRPYTPLLGREWDPAAGAFLPLWGDPFSRRYPAYQRLDLTGSRSLRLLDKLVILYVGITNLLDNKNISRFDYGSDYAKRKDQQSIFGRSLFIGLCVPFF